MIADTRDNMKLAKCAWKVVFDRGGVQNYQINNLILLEHLCDCLIGGVA